MSKDPFGICLEPKCEDEQPSPDLPPVYQQIKGFIGSAKDIVGGAMVGEGLLVEESVYETRMSLCRDCVFFRKEDERCSQCGCFMRAKAMFKKTSCPQHKWSAVNA